MQYGIQMYSLRDITGKDMEGALKQVAEMGYKFVEFAGFFGHPAEEIKGWLDKYGLECSGTHTGWTEIRDNFEETVKYHKTIGTDNIIIPGADLSTEQKLDEFIDFLNEFEPRLRKEGIRLGYHNHSHEFIPTSYGKIIHSEIENRTDVELEIDTYWAYHAGVDPVQLMGRLSDRITVIHIKDGLESGEGKPLGMGTAPVEEVYMKAREMGFLMVVESETLTPSGAEEARICIEFLRKQE
ncbi:MAG: sugar phosphate isomerase/epimerase [Clostridia bacterium]|nr:sugar phosphate isomerase/epimerase [Clostridia bacterium]